MGILRLMLQTSIAGHHSSRGQTLDREDGFPLLAVSMQEMMLLLLEEFTTWLQIHLLKLERWKQPGVNEHAEAYAANIYNRPPQQQRGVHDVAIDTSAETRNLEGKLDALVNLVTPLAVNHKTTSVARVCDIRSSNDHNTNVCPSSYAKNDAIVIRGVHDVATDTSGEIRMVEGKLDALVNLLTQLVVNQKPASVARRRWLPTPSSFSARNDVIVIRGVHDVATDTSAETRKVEVKLDALVNLVTQLAVNQKPAYVPRVCHQSSRGQTLDREDGFQLLAVAMLEMMPLSLEEFTMWLQIYLLKLEMCKEATTAAEAKHLIEKMASNS
ncbi:hypothetical protein Fmac_024844 [Flemingia macrophylla]|uniref:Uncharacterized protein n=1 Tax=Flemingia macrophylla TaxID=520843 RepID=A0ABD1LQI7_9FABA